MNSTRNNLLKLMWSLRRKQRIERKLAPHAMHFLYVSYVVNLFFSFATIINEPEINDINNKLDFSVFIPFLRLLITSFFFCFSFFSPPFGMCQTRLSQVKTIPMVIKIYWLEPVLIVQFKLKYSAMASASDPKHFF